MVRLVLADREALITQINILYNCVELKSISEHGTQQTFREKVHETIKWSQDWLIG